MAQAAEKAFCGDHSLQTIALPPRRTSKPDCHVFYLRKRTEKAADKQRCNGSYVRAGAGAEKIYTDTFTGTKMDQPEWDRLRAQLRRGDVLIVARATDPDFREGRPPKFDTEQLDHAMELLENHSYAQTAKLTGISKSTLIRERKRRKIQSICQVV